MIEHLDVQVATSDLLQAQCFEIRTNVFIKEQGVAAHLERDEHDQTATHLLLTANQQAIGAARIRIVGKAGKIERVCILEPYRNKGYGATLMKKIEEAGFEEGVDELVLNAQEPALAFYLRLGYVKTSERFFEAGIPHFSMKKGR
ncbi:GNAT family N-acetyltransferase [Shouchella lehensis]|uniref:GNAT family N-acetyltransferase n=1 Tax=Shouchella lehensis TaxID=300825 RepID=A0A4Y7WJK6_9BACI|nr:GNAT family N-acetyltransferase [Shouchella lehensis]MBG9785752.1 hypothetical protein [Shouchella lehensis]TES48218.1 GNAT family N-acetyltransferase [Shouchella lehensis]